MSLNQKTIEEFFNDITVEYSESPMFITYERQALIPSFLSITVSRVKEEDIEWYENKTDALDGIATLLTEVGTKFDDVLPEAKDNQPDIDTLTELEIAAYHIARMTRRGVGNILVGGRYVIYSKANINVDMNNIDGGFMVIHDNGRYGLVTNEGLSGTSGYIVALPN